MNEERINILIASDINYAPYYGVMLTSLFINNSDSLFDIYLITDETWPEKETRKFEKLCAKYNSLFHVYAIDATKMDGFPKTGHINKATYYNLNAANILPKDVHRVIYMDGDMIVNGDIRPLWEMDLQGNACAMVPNCTYFDQSYYDRLGYDSKWGYYNNGTTVYSLDYLRKIHFAERAIKLITDYPDRMIWMDQDAQNALLYDKMLTLPFIYNFQTLFFDKLKWETYSDSFKKKVMDAAENPIIVHYNGRLKPWQYQYYLMPYGKLWNKVCLLSPWKKAPIRKPFIKYIKHILKRIGKHLALVEIRNKEFTKESIRFS